ncbi:hypothetical protein [Pontiella agarivorans]|uniref:Uncharacterized protein n=1 Tax=Pontiella agarivorans TaxID=3038953 RepID=A0ABU5MZD6_9BACT|nr:hypothetical protein [Pontiella agarivorans]MDZ8119523.1 hypothetical protein [Pontiella agarivorans]
MKKYNTLILLCVISGLLTPIWSLALSKSFTQFAAANEIDVSRVLLIKIFIDSILFIFPAIWTVKNPPKCLNRWLSFFMILIFGFKGVIGYLVLMGLDHVKAAKQN